MKVDRFDIDVGVEGVLIEEDRAACIVGHVKSFLKNIVINKVRRFLQGNDMPFHRNLFRTFLIALLLGYLIGNFERDCL